MQRRKRCKRTTLSDVWESDGVSWSPVSEFNSLGKAKKSSRDGGGGRRRKVSMGGRGENICSIAF